LVATRRADFEDLLGKDRNERQYNKTD
jgi:hypothetical protein